MAHEFSIGKRGKGQVGVELMMLMAFIIFVFSAYYFAMFKKSVDTYYDSITLEATKIARQIALVVDIVYTNGDGYSQSIYLPANILGKDYDVTISSNLVILNFSDRYVYVKTLAEKVNGRINRGNKNIFENVDGEIYVRSEE